MESCADGTILLNTATKHIAADPYFLTVDESDDRWYTFPSDPPDAAMAAQVASCAEALFPSETTYICSYKQMTIDGETLDFYEYYDDENQSLLCVIALDSESNYSLYDVMDNSYTSIIVKS